MLAWHRMGCWQDTHGLMAATLTPHAPSIPRGRNDGSHSTAEQELGLPHVRAQLAKLLRDIHDILNRYCPFCFLPAGSNFWRGARRPGTTQLNNAGLPSPKP